jgi:molybdopterin synthase catalytic subunit
MSQAPLFAITTAPLDLSGVISAVQSAADGAALTGAAGAVTAFWGVVRGENLGRRVVRLEYEAYEPLAVKTFLRIAEEARASWPGAHLAIHHRIGTLAPAEASVAVAAAAAHRAEAFCACRFAIERVKQIAPIWKHEYFEGGDVWIEGATANPEDHEAREEARRRACA